MKQKIENTESYKIAMEEYSDLFGKYDFYMIEDLKDLKNENNIKVFFCKKENFFLVVTGKDLKKTILKKMAKDKRFEVTKNDFKKRKGFCNNDGAGE